MEEKLLNEFQSFCRFNCKYKKGKDIVESVVTTNYRDLKAYIKPCNYCQVKEFIRDVGDRL
ncbi:hypothetical protein ACR77J_07120 [Tissierella praeacuta]|uniref:hypothetical protein n=1 Tax=Tissierella praeacuta TaxID=43131 RepID=UPI003DA2441F